MNEMKDLEAGQDEFVRILAPRVDGRWIESGDPIARNPRILFRLTLFAR